MPMRTYNRDGKSGQQKVTDTYVACDAAKSLERCRADCLFKLSRARISAGHATSHDSEWCMQGLTARKVRSKGRNPSSTRYHAAQEMT